MTETNDSVVHDTTITEPVQDNIKNEERGEDCENKEREEHSVTEIDEVRRSSRLRKEAPRYEPSFLGKKYEDSFLVSWVLQVRRTKTVLCTYLYTYCLRN